MLSIGNDVSARTTPSNVNVLPFLQFDIDDLLRFHLYTAMSGSCPSPKDIACSQGGVSCGASPLSLNITNHIHHNHAIFGQSIVTSPVKMSLFEDHKPVKLKKNDYQSNVKVTKKKGSDRKKSAVTLMTERDEIVVNANEKITDGNVSLQVANESHLDLYSVCKEAVQKSHKQHKEAKSMQTNIVQKQKKIEGLEKKLAAKDESIRKLNDDITTLKDKKKSAEATARDHKDAFQLSLKSVKEANTSLTTTNKQLLDELKGKEREIDRLTKENERLKSTAATKSAADGTGKSGNSLQEKLQYEWQKGMMQNMLKSEQERNKMENKNKRLAQIASGGGMLSGGGALSFPTGLSGDFSQFLGNYMVR